MVFFLYKRLLSKLTGLIFLVLSGKRIGHAFGPDCLNAKELTMPRHSPICNFIQK